MNTTQFAHRNIIAAPRRPCDDIRVFQTGGELITVTLGEITASSPSTSTNAGLVASPCRRQPYPTMTIAPEPALPDGMRDAIKPLCRADAISVAAIRRFPSPNPEHPIRRSNNELSG